MKLVDVTFELEIFAGTVGKGTSGGVPELAVVIATTTELDEPLEFTAVTTVSYDVYCVRLVKTADGGLRI